MRLTIVSPALYRTRTHPHEYALARDGYVWAVVWHLERDEGIFVRPAGALTGLYYYWDEVVAVDALPGAGNEFSQMRHN